MKRKNKILLFFAVFILLVGLFIRFKRNVFYTPKVMLSVVDEDSGVPLSQALVHVGWYGMSFEGFSIKEEWRLTDGKGQLEIAPFNIILYFSGFDGLSLEIFHPLCETNYWTDGIDPLNERLATQPDPPTINATVKMKSYAKLMEKSNCCNDEKGKPACTPANPDYGKLTFNLSWYFFLIKEHGLRTEINVETTKRSLKLILRQIFKDCEQRYSDTIRELDNEVK